MAIPSPARAALVLLSSGGILCSTPARAEEEAITARLEWVRGPGTEACADEDSLKSAVNQRWGRNVFLNSATPDIVLKGRVGRAEPNGWTVSLALYRADGTSLGSRELVTAAPSCASLDDSVALAVGLMLDISRNRIVEERRASAEQAARAEDAGSGKKPPEAVLEGPKISIPKETQPARAPWRAGPSAGIEVALGLLPSWSVAPRVGIAAVPPRFVPVELAVSVFLTDTGRANGGRGARFTAWTVEAAVCPISVRGPKLRSDTCLVERLGEVRATGFGFTENAVAQELISTIGAREVGTFQLAGPLGLFLGLAIEAPLVRYRFVFGDVSGAARSVHEMASIAGTGALGLSLEW